MNNILYINACCRESSRTDELAQHLLSGLDGNVHQVKLYEKDLKPLDANRLEEIDRLLREGMTDAEMLFFARQFAEADIIVIPAFSAMQRIL